MAQRSLCSVRTLAIWPRSSQSFCVTACSRAAPNAVPDSASPQSAERADAQAAGDSQTDASAGAAASGSVVSRLASTAFRGLYGARTGLAWAALVVSASGSLGGPCQSGSPAAHHRIDRSQAGSPRQRGDATPGRSTAAERIAGRPEHPAQRAARADSAGALATRGWSFTVEVVLRSSQTDRCRAADDPTLWLTLSAESGVFVAGGIAHRPAP